MSNSFLKEFKEREYFNQCTNSEELDNLNLAKIIADCQGKDLIYEMVDFHSSRPGHDLRYSLSGEKMKKLGWTPQPVRERLKEVVEWTLKNERWIKL